MCRNTPPPSRLGHRYFEAGDLTGAITAYGHARTIYRGSLMEGDVSGDWFRDDELILRDEYHSVLERLGAVLLQHGEFNASIEVGRELVSADPCRKRVMNYSSSVRGTPAASTGTSPVPVLCLRVAPRTLCRTERSNPSTSGRPAVGNAASGLDLRHAARRRKSGSQGSAPGGSNASRASACTAWRCARPRHDPCGP